jgi:hypothetical protein
MTNLAWFWAQTFEAAEILALTALWGLRIE